MNIKPAKEILSQYDCKYSDEEIEAGLEFLDILIDLLPNVNEIPFIKREEARLNPACHSATFRRKKKSGASNTSKKSK